MAYLQAPARKADSDGFCIACKANPEEIGCTMALQAQVIVPSSSVAFNIAGCTLVMRFHQMDRQLRCASDKQTPDKHCVCEHEARMVQQY